MLESAGYRPVTGDGEQADVVVFNTCAVRENADNKLYGNLGHLYPAKQANPDMQIAVGGCLAQKDRGEIVRRAPWVDVVFGTHNLAHAVDLHAKGAPVASTDRRGGRSRGWHTSEEGNTDGHEASAMEEGSQVLVRGWRPGRLDPVE